METVPPADPFGTLSPTQVQSNWTLGDMQWIVNRANPTGGWVQSVFHDITPQAFTDFVIWLADAQAQGRVIVRTVGEVIGGPVQPMPAGTP